ncbi:MAG: sensor histidine kinase [Rhodocyclaceae bacterium]
MNPVPSASRLDRAMLVLGLAGLVALSLLLFAISSQLSAVVANVQDLAADRYPKAQLVRDILQDDAMSILLLREITLHGDAEQRQALIDKSRRHADSADAAMAELGRLLSTPGGREIFARQHAARQHAAAAKRDYVEAVERLPLPTPRGDSLAATIQALRESMSGYVMATKQQEMFQDALVAERAHSSLKYAERAYWMLIAAWVLFGGALLGLGILWRLRLREQAARHQERINTMVQHRDTLVREVHHRIKNHLQGLMGLIQDQQRLKAERSNELDTLLGHVMSLVAVHGMQARNVSEQVPLGELIGQQVALFRQSPLARAIRIVAEGEELRLAIPAENAVPLALVISELLLNACKHGDHRSGEIRLHYWQDAAGAHVRIGNPVARPVQIDPASDQGLGTGLALVKSMLVDLGELKTGGAAGYFSIEVVLPPPAILMPATPP